MPPLFQRQRSRALGLVVAAALAVATPVAAHDTPAEAANKQLVLDFYAALNAAEGSGAAQRPVRTIIEQYLSPDYVQHSDTFANLPGPGSARDKLVRMFESMPAPPPGAMPPQSTVAVTAEGDLVMLLTSRMMPNPAGGPARPSNVFNMFRVRDGKLAEHWDVSSAPMGPGGPPPGAAVPPR